jgi:hypothetical protein
VGGGFRMWLELGELGGAEEGTVRRYLVSSSLRVDSSAAGNRGMR